jgi:hypothetical protein
MTYIQPSSKPLLPKNLTLEQFLQTVLVGLSGISGDMVRPKWQPAPPKQPDISTNWLAFGITQSTPDANAFVSTDVNGVTTLQRHEELELGCSFYGPLAFEYCNLVRDGFHVSQNLEALRSANMGFKEVGKPLHMSELVNERFFNRYEMTISLRREIQRVYPVPTLIGAGGTIYTVTGKNEILNWKTKT